MPTNFTRFSYRTLREGYAKKEFTPSEVIASYLNQMAAHRNLNAYITETADHAMAMAKAADQRQQHGKMLPLDGFPLAVKDIFCTKGVRTTAGSKMLENFVPFYESTVTQKLADVGAIMLGKVNMDEFAMGSSNETSAYGPCISPWKSHLHDKDITPGGSSGGSTSAVAAQMALAALGTDTGGSIRQPAAFTGLVGLKPTYGRCSRRGIIAFASSLDQAGPIGRNIEDTACLFQYMSGHDPQDATSAHLPSFKMSKGLDTSIKGLKVGIPIEYRSKDLSAEMQAWWDKTAAWLKDEGAEIMDISLPHTDKGLPAYYIIAPAEAAANLARYDGVRFGLRVEGDTLDALYENTRTQGFGEEVKCRIMIGNYVLSAGAYEDFYLRGLQVRRLFRNEMKEAFKKVDVLLTPTTPTPAFAIGEKINDPMAMYLSDMYTVASNLAGMPGLSVPVGLSESGLPIGMQLLGADNQEELLLRVGYHIEQHAGFSAHALKEVA